MTDQSTDFLGQSPDIRRLLNSVRMVAATGAPVIIRGESGSGKELLAREIHRFSPRRNKPFEVIRCISAGEAEVTKAFERARGGSLFLKSVGDMDKPAQTVVLRALESGNEDVRIVSGTSGEVQLRLQSGEFRPDLFYRLNVVPLDMPPLRGRSDDIILLLKHYTKDYAKRYGRAAPRYAVSARNLLKTHVWPGNLHELRNLAERMVILMSGVEIKADNLPAEFQRKSASGADFFRIPEEGIDLFAVERDILSQALNMARGNKSKAARLLGLSRDTLLYRIRKYEL